MHAFFGLQPDFLTQKNGDQRMNEGRR